MYIQRYKEQYKKRYKKSGKMRRVRLVCSKCGRRCNIDTMDKTIYTKEVRTNFICLFCSDSLLNKE